MKNLSSVGTTLTVANGATAQVSGDGFKVANMIGYWLADVAADAVGVLQMEGVISAKCLTTDTIAIGDELHWDDVAKQLTTTALANTFVGRAWEAKASGPATVLVKLQQAGLLSGVRSFIAGAAIAVHLRVKITSGKLAVAGVTAKEIGTITVAALADLDVRPVTLRTAPGTVRMIANATLAVGVAVFTAAAGKVGPSVTTGFLLGETLTASAADGDVIEVLRNMHGDTVVT